MPVHYIFIIRYLKLKNYMSINNQRVQMTPVGYRQLVDELDQLEKVQLSEAIDRVAKAREFGDLSALEGRIDELKDIINRVTVVDAPSKNEDEISIGSKVNIAINGSDHEFTIVGEWEADPASKKISHESPLGKALIGKKVGETVDVEAPAGKITYAIKSIQ